MRYFLAIALSVVCAFSVIAQSKTPPKKPAAPPAKTTDAPKPKQYVQPAGYDQSKVSYEAFLKALSEVDKSIDKKAPHFRIPKSYWFSGIIYLKKVSQDDKEIPDEGWDYETVIKDWDKCVEVMEAVWTVRTADRPKNIYVDAFKNKHYYTLISLHIGENAEPNKFQAYWKLVNAKLKLTPNATPPTPQPKKK